MVEGKGKGEAEVVQPDAKTTRVRPIEDEGNETMNEGDTPPTAKKARLLESMELHWIEQAETVGTCALCGCCVDESGGCLRCQIVRLPEANEG